MNTLKVYDRICEILDVEYSDSHVSDNYISRTKVKIKKYLEALKE